MRRLRGCLSLLYGAALAVAVLALLENADVCVGPVNDFREAMDDPQLNARGMFVENEHPEAGKLKLINFPVKMSLTPGEVRTPAPLLGQHNADVLREVGVTKEEIEELKKEGII